MKIKIKKLKKINDRNSCSTKTNINKTFLINVNQILNKHIEMVAKFAVNYQNGLDI